MTDLWWNGIPVPMQYFPNGEIRWDVTPEWVVERSWLHNTVSWRWIDDRSSLALWMFGQWLDTYHFPVYQLDIAYLPYSRMDRRDSGHVFPLQTISQICAMVHAETVTIVDPHSDVSVALVPNAVPVYPVLNLIESINDYIKAYYPRVGDPIIALPDAGAEKRYAGKFSIPTVVGVKHRNPAIGAATYQGIIGTIPKMPVYAIIVDDLCAYDNTFIQMAEILRAQGISRVFLYVAHAERILEQGTLLKSGVIDHMFTTDTIMDRPHPHFSLTVMDIWAQRLKQMEEFYAIQPWK